MTQPGVTENVLDALTVNDLLADSMIRLDPSAAQHDLAIAVTDPLSRRVIEVPVVYGIGRLTPAQLQHTGGGGGGLGHTVVAQSVPAPFHVPPAAAQAACVRFEHDPSVAQQAPSGPELQTHDGSAPAVPTTILRDWTHNARVPDLM